MCVGPFHFVSNHCESTAEPPTSAPSLLKVHLTACIDSLSLLEVGNSILHSSVLLSLLFDLIGCAIFNRRTLLIYHTSNYKSIWLSSGCTLFTEFVFPMKCLLVPFTISRVYFVIWPGSLYAISTTANNGIYFPKIISHTHTHAHVLWNDCRLSTNI